MDVSLGPLKIWTIIGFSTALVATSVVILGRSSGIGLDEFLTQIQDVTAEAGTMIVAGWVTFSDWVEHHYARVPALMLGLAALIMLPVTAVVAAVFRWLSPREHAIAPTISHNVSKHHIPPWPSKAVIKVLQPAPNGTGQYFEVGHSVVRIGRASDVDIAIPDPSVHRYHATIHRTENSEYLITDMSAGFGHGVLVNGKSVYQKQVFNGDQIELGRAKLAFLTS